MIESKSEKKKPNNTVFRFKTIRIRFQIVIEKGRPFRAFYCNEEEKSETEVTHRSIKGNGRRTKKNRKKKGNIPNLRLLKVIAFPSFFCKFFFCSLKYSSDQKKRKEICFIEDALALDRAKLSKLVCCGWGDEQLEREERREEKRGECFSIMAFTFLLFF